MATSRNACAESDVEQYERNATNTDLFLPSLGNDLRLGAHLAHLSSSALASASAAAEHDDLLLPRSNSGVMEAEDDLERTWRVTQGEIKEGTAVGSRDKGFSLRLEEFGPYEVDYTRNGRCVSFSFFLRVSFR
jgi:hypothetical protein